MGVALAWLDIWDFIGDTLFFWWNGWPWGSTYDDDGHRVYQKRGRNPKVRTK